MKIYFAFILFFIISFSGFSQTCSPLPTAVPKFKIFDAFGIEINKICVNSTITLADSSNGGCNIFYKIDSLNAPGDTVVSNKITLLRSFSYNKPGKYRISQFGSFKATGSYSSKDFFVIGPPVFKIFHCSNYNVKIIIDSLGYDNYLVDFGDGNTQLVNNSGGTINHFYTNSSPRLIKITGNLTSCSLSVAQSTTPFQNLVAPAWIDVTKTGTGNDIIRFNNVRNYLNYKVFQKNLNTNIEKLIISFSDTSNTSIKLQIPTPDTLAIYQYYIKAFTGCNEEINSRIIQTLTFNIQSIPNQIILSWKPYSGDDFLKYQFYKNGILLTESSVQAQAGLSDVNVVCNRDYQYQLIIVLKNNIFSYPLVKKAKAITTYIPPSIINISGTVENNKIILSWPSPTAGVKNYFVSLNDQVIYNGEGNNFKISQAFNTPACYKIIYADSCGNQALPTLACPVFLTKNNNELEWNAYQGWSMGVKNYDLEVLDENNNVEKIIYSGLNLNYLLPGLDKTQQIFRFRIKSIGKQTGLVSYSNIFIWQQQSLLSVPNAFTPNGDHLNPAFKADGLFIKTFELIIFNRWGQVIFSSTNIDKGWDGIIQNQEAPVDNYIYNINAVDYAGATIKRNGTFVLIR